LKKEAEKKELERLDKVEDDAIKKDIVVIKSMIERL
jgi:hypothetical protein